MKKIFFFLCTFCTLYSCDSDEALIAENSGQKNEQTVEVLSFSSKEEFSEAIRNYDLDKKLVTRSSDSFYSADEYYDDAAGDSVAEEIGFLVPDEKYRNFLNKNMEIVVNDTLYKITKEGTFYAKLDDKEELYNAIKNVDAFKLVSEDVKELGHVKLKDTFHRWNGKKSTPITDDHFFDDEGMLEDDGNDDGQINEISTTRSSYHRPLNREDIEKFENVGAVNVNIFDKIVRFSPSYMKDTKITFKSNKNRRLYVSLYKYDYGFGITIGLDCKVMKKLWHGLSWGRMVNWDQGVYYGISALIIRQEIKEPVFNQLMNSNKAILANQWQSVNNHNYSTYASATSSFNGGIANKWVTEYNGNPTKSPYTIPVVGDAVETLVSNIEYIDKWFPWLGAETAAAVSAKLFDNFIKNKGIGLMRSLDTSDSGRKFEFFSEQDHAVYIMYSNDLAWNQGGYRVHDKFLKYYRSIEIGGSYIFGNGGNSKISGPSFNLHDDDLLGTPSIVYCEGLVFTEDGDDWIGARIYHNPDKLFGDK